MSERKTFPENMLDDTLKRVAEELDEDINIYLIGGGAMIFYGRKAATKDIDIVFLDPQPLQAFIDAAIKAGFRPVEEPEEEYRKIGAWIILEADSGIRLDLFNKKVCDALEVKDTVVARTNHHSDIGKLHVYLMSPEDIVLFKGITEREADLEDIRILAEAGIDWGVVEEECLSQEGSGDWSNLLVANLSELRRRYGIDPRLPRLMDYADSYVLRKSFKTFLQDKELSFAELQEIVHERTGYSPSWTRTKLRELEEEGFIASRLDGRRKKYRIKQVS